MEWPDGTKYHVHIFELDAKGVPHEAAALFRTTLEMNNGYRLHRSRVLHWWEFAIAGAPWWAKAHDRTFDCEQRWAGTGLRAAPARARMAGTA